MNTMTAKFWLAVTVLFLVLVVNARGEAQASTWQEIDSFQTSGASGFGYGLDIDGDLAVIGALGGVPSDPFGPGAAYVYARDVNGEWNQQVHLTASDNFGNNDFGESVAISGETVLVGAFRTEPYGAAYVYEMDGFGDWYESAKLTPNDDTLAGQFGRRVALDGDTAAMGSLAAWNITSRGGAVYIFERDAGGNWSQIAKLFPDDVQAGDEFGSAIALVGDTLVVGAYASDPNGSQSGSAYVFGRSEMGAWEQLQKLTPSDGNANDYFGSSVATDGETVVVGAILDSAVATESGSAYVFERIGALWVEVAKLNPSDAGASDIFGYQSSVSGDHILITAAYADRAGTNNGATYAFEKGPSGTWVETQRLIPSGDQSELNFGTNVSISNGVALISTNLSSGGPVYSFEMPSTTPFVSFDTQGYDGTWELIDDSSGNVLFSGIGDLTIDLEPGFYLLDISNSFKGTDYIEVLADGQVVSGNPVAFTGGNAQVTFNTGTVIIDPSDFEGIWSLISVADYDTTVQPGPQSHTLVLGINYIFRPAGHTPANVAFAVDGFGEVSSFNPVAAIGIGNVLKINTSVIIVDPGFYDGLWAIRGVRQFDTAVESGPQIIRLIPSLGFVVRIANQSSADFQIQLDADGNVMSLNDKAASTLGDLINFHTHRIDIDPGVYSGDWRFVRWEPVSGQNSFELLPGLTYRIWAIAGPDGHFFVDDPCAVNPSQLQIDGGTFDISCGLRDLDGDGVPDVSDNCVLEPNPDQIDQDLDGAGNACDDDLDGDGVDNALDNCPDFENAGQEDLDGDGIGDVCDDDADQDSVNNQVDNCPYVANTDQGDNDLDGIGDVCDNDDDNDTIADVVDNCPLDANPDQADFDQNGQGDACDGDLDGDGVGNEDDLCELSPQSSLVNEYGCSGAQFIALLCNANDFAQHGQYVSCVAHAANEAVDQGLISPEERARFVREAAKSN